MDALGNGERIAVPSFFHHWKFGRAVLNETRCRRSHKKGTAGVCEPA